TRLQPCGIVPVDDQDRVGSKANRRIKLRFDPNAVYTIELWTHSPVTRDAVLAALEHHFKLVRADDPADPAVIHFTGATGITVVLRDGTDLAAGITRPSGDKRPESALRKLHADHVLTT